MNYITAEEFLSQTDKVKMSLLNYANQNITDYDLIFEEGKVYSYKDFVKRENIEADSVPLLQMHQLIQFIEDKTYCKLGIEHYNENDILFRLYKDNKEIKSSIYYDTDLLQALWRMTIQILEEI